MPQTAPVCGNDAIEEGEACDDTSACCTSCQLATSAECSCVELDRVLRFWVLCVEFGFCASFFINLKLCASFYF